MRAYSFLEVKQIQDERRTFSGISTTPTPDRVQDVVVAEGAIFEGPINLHLYHNHNMPVGYVDFARPKKTGIPFEAQIPEVAEAGTIRERVNEAWHSVKYRLLRSVSIGFAPMPNGVELLKSGGLKFNSWRMLELSLVGVPANPEAVVTAFKSLDGGIIREALGLDIEDDEGRREIIKRLSNGSIALIQPKKIITEARLAGGAVKLLK